MILANKESLSYIPYYGINHKYLKNFVKNYIN